MARTGGAERCRISPSPKGEPAQSGQLQDSLRGQGAGGGRIVLASGGRESRGTWVSPSTAEMTSRSQALDMPPSTTLQAEASKIDWPPCSPCLWRAWAMDWKTVIMAMPEPEPSERIPGSFSMGTMLATSSKTRVGGGTRREFGKAAAGSAPHR